MKLFRHGAPGAERPGIVAADGSLRDLSLVVADIGPAALAPQGIERMRALDASALPMVPADARIGACVGGVGKFIGIGLNYADHAAEAGMPVPAEPVVFMKAGSCIAGPDDAIEQPRGSTKLDWEVELGVVIGTRAKYVSESEALAHVAGYCVVNDVSERNFQIERGGQWDKGKSHDGFGPLGPWLVSADEVRDPQALELWLDVNGERMQTGSTRTMIFSCAQIVSYLSRFMTLHPGDVIATGTPPGVGMGRKPPRWLVPGDIVTLGVQGLGEQRQVVVALD